MIYDQFLVRDKKQGPDFHQGLASNSVWAFVNRLLSAASDQNLSLTLHRQSFIQRFFLAGGLNLPSSIAAGDPNLLQKIEILVTAED